MVEQEDNNKQFVSHLRHAASYVHAHRGSTCVILISGAALDSRFAELVHDIALLHTLGIRVVLVHGARHQIEQRLKMADSSFQYVNGLRITDDKALACVKDAAGSLRIEIEARLSMGLPNTPMAGAKLRVASGNYVTARPLGILNGVDYCHTGKVRRIDAQAIHEHLDDQRIVLISPLGYSPTGEVFNLSAEDVATATAVALQADKLVIMTELTDLRSSENGLIKQLNLTAVDTLLANNSLPDTLQHELSSAVTACRGGVERAHIINQHIEGSLLLELFTRDGVGILVSNKDYEGLRQANIDDVGGILALLQPMEASGALVKRSRELLEIEIEYFLVIERDGMIIACAALYLFPDGMAELACLAVHNDYRGHHKGNTLLGAIEEKARDNHIKSLFVLTAVTSHWFQERGFKSADIDSLPVDRKQMYNLQRQSKVLVKEL
ncbi:MAG: amino-acid N-acetyltransferase [Gammaproteobacteria bacterium]